MKKTCEIARITLENDSGIEVPSVSATCPDCGASTESFGQGANSIRRCLVLMKEACECEDSEKTFFVCDELDD